MQVLPEIAQRVGILKNIRHHGVGWVDVGTRQGCDQVPRLSHGVGWVDPTPTWSFYFLAASHTPNRSPLLGALALGVVPTRVDESVHKSPLS